MNPILDVARRTGLARLVRPLLYPLRDAYFRVRAAPKRWQHRAEVGGIVSSFPTANWFEYRRARTLAGERDIIRTFLDDLDGDEVVWDVGANVGMYTCFVAQALTTGTVVAFEPEPANLARLRANLESNARPTTWQTAGIALAAENGTTLLASSHRAADTAQPGTGHYYLSDDDGIEVPCRRGDSLVDDGYPPPDVMKIDVQGAELLVLEGMGEYLSSVETIYAELHTEKCERYDVAIEEVESFLVDAGFSLSSLGEPDHYRSGVYHVLASRTG